MLRLAQIPIAASVSYDINKPKRDAGAKDTAQRDPRIIDNIIDFSIGFLNKLMRIAGSVPAQDRTVSLKRWMPGMQPAQSELRSDATQVIWAMR
jgi:hypothetical protein